MPIDPLMLMSLTAAGANTPTEVDNGLKMMLFGGDNKAVKAVAMRGIVTAATEVNVAKEQAETEKAVLSADMAAVEGVLDAVAVAVPSVKDAPEPRVKLIADLKSKTITAAAAVEQFQRNAPMIAERAAEATAELDISELSGAFTSMKTAASEVLTSFANGQALSAKQAEKGAKIFFKMLTMSGAELSDKNSLDDM